jgi:5-methylcytosine-specific restriction endonuclease McrA
MKGPAEFYAGRLTRCKACHNKASSERAQKRGKGYRAAISRAWYSRNKAKHMAIQQRRRARKLGAPRVDLEHCEWVALLTEYQWRCAYCGASAPLEKDHAVPLSRGGAHTAANIVPACRSCNASKHTRTVEEWLSGTSIGRDSYTPEARQDVPRQRPSIGSKRPLAKLDESAVLQIKVELLEGTATQKSLAGRYGIHPSIICEIASGKRWKHVKVTG